MNQTVVAIVVGLAVAAGAVLLLDGLRPAGTSTAPSAADLSGIERRLDAIEARLGKDGHAGLATQGAQPEVLRRLDRIEKLVSALAETGGVGTQDGAERGPGPLARIEKRLGAIEDKLGDGGGASPARVRPHAKRRVSLDEAARALELSSGEQDELLRIYDDFHAKLYKIAAGKDGHPDDVRREVEAARRDPTKRMGLLTKYMPRMLADFPALMAAQTARDQAIEKAIGPEKARRLDRDFDVKEDNLLGLGGSVRTEMRVDGGGR